MDDRLCLLVIIGVTELGRKELVAVEDGYRESTASWEELLVGLRERGLKTPPKLAIGDGALGFWKAMAKTCPSSRHQRCWVHKTANVLNKLPKSMQPKVKEALHNIWMAATRDEAHAAFDRALVRFNPKYTKAMECLAKDREELLAFYDFPAEHGVHISDHQPDRVDLCRGPATHETNPKLRISRYDVGDGLQAAGVGAEELEKD